MIPLFPYFFSFVLGLLILDSLWKNSDNLNLSLRLTLATGIGLGFSSILTFLSFLLWNQFTPTVIVGLNIALLGGLLAVKATKVLKNQVDIKKILYLPKIRFPQILLVMFWSGVSWVIYFHATKHPFGEWDAWALWNMKTKFLLLHGNSWKDIFYALHWHTQPDYPLLLPFMNVWISSFAKEYLTQIPLTTSVVFSVLCGILLYCGLGRFIPKRVAFVASCLLFFNPYYVFLSTAQYADILLAFYLLASFILIPIMIRHDDNNTALVTGVVLGLMTFTKNEGIVMALLLTALIYLYRTFEKMRNAEINFSLIRWLLTGLVIGSFATIIFKLFLAPPNRDILTNMTKDHLKYLNWSGFLLVKDAFIEQIMDKRWCLVWILILVGGALGWKRLFTKECKILSAFMLIYSLIVLFIYLTTVNFDLSWRLTSTLRRIFLYLFPSLLFLCFYVHWRREETS